MAHSFRFVGVCEHPPVCDESLLEPSRARAGSRRVLLRLVATANEYVHRDELARKSAKRRVADVTKRLGVLGARELRELCTRSRE